MSVGLHYEVEAYISAGGVVLSRPHGEQWVTFNTLYNSRPPNTRFAVGRKVPLVVNRDLDPNTPLYTYGQPGEWCAWDFYDSDFLMLQAQKPAPRFDEHIEPPLSRWGGLSADALVMKAVALYEKP